MPDNDFGPVITKQHQQKVVGYIDSAEQQGAIGGSRWTSTPASKAMKMVSLWAAHLSTASLPTWTATMPRNLWPSIAGGAGGYHARRHGSD